MVPADDVIALASLAGQTIVTAAVTDAWETARRKISGLLGRGDTSRAELTERRLDQTHSLLMTASGSDLEEACVAQAERWTGRVADLLEEDPHVEAELRAALREIQAMLPAPMAAAFNQGSGRSARNARTP